ncbi:DUF3054 domain-containing protein [Halobacteria archaeon AArc-curdl1]|uniref:DUF3054 domain-containing protein n=1 Tax=Natronosalvus hydrolyticus TaxID=2979988 RepID=A0AAP3E755_9EURY|nr:DUF3054 domain-containing protein [Halobacteria archaeon AArc-curdl1]
MSTITSTRRLNRLDRRKLVTTAAVLVGDVAVLLAFIGVGLLVHSIEPWQYPLHTLRTTTPFFLAWVAIAPLLGVYRRRTLSSYYRTLWLTILAWVLVSIVGAYIRATSYFPGGAPLEFLIVNIGFGLLFVLPWRVAVTLLVRRFLPP